jgi:hypothetical protein
LELNEFDRPMGSNAFERLAVDGFSGSFVKPFNFNVLQLPSTRLDRVPDAVLYMAVVGGEC